MKLISSLRTVAALALGLAFVPGALAQENPGKAKPGPAGYFIKVDFARVSAEWLAQARAGYPLDTCVVAGDKLDSEAMGETQDFVYRAEGKPDRLVRLCCITCIRDLRKNPAKYLEVIDQAAAAKTRAAPSK